MSTHGIPQAEDTSGVNADVLIYVIVLLVVVNVALICLYRRCSNKEIKDDMQLQVNSAVSQYFALSNRGQTMSIQ